MSAWVIRKATACHAFDDQLWTSVTLAVRSQRNTLAIRSKLFPSKTTTFSKGTWTHEETGITAPARIMTPSRVEFLERGNVTDRAGEAYESAAISGVFFGLRQAKAKNVEIEILDAAGCVGSDLTGFAVAAAGALLTAVAPTMDIKVAVPPEWRISKTECPGAV